MLVEICNIRGNYVRDDYRRKDWRKRGVDNTYQKPGIKLGGNEDDLKNYKSKSLMIPLRLFTRSANL